MNFSYLRPPNKVNSLHHPDSYIVSRREGQLIRRIFHNVQLTAFEKQQIASMRKRQTAYEFAFPEQDADLLKFLYANGFDAVRTAEHVRKNRQWFAKYGTISVRSLRILEEGAIYSYGRDFYYRPIIIASLAKINLVQNSIDDYLTAVTALMNLIVKEMFVPGKVQNCMVIVDTLKFQPIQLSTMQSIINGLCDAYPQCLERMFFINCSEVMKSKLDMMIRCMPGTTSNKMTILGRVADRQLLKYLNPHELENKYGGDQENLTQFWPMRSTNRIMHDESMMHATEVHQNSVDFQSVMNDSRFFGDKEELPEPQTGGCCSNKMCILF